ncbi:MAG: response regulator transcription factor [Bacteroidota bacterium]|nr:response regulator transcription factor [Bacteroidota bacterium]
MKNKITVAIVDDHSLFREGIIAILKDYQHIEVMFEAPNGVELLERLKRQKPQVIVLDIEMPLMNGQEATVQIKNLYPDIKIIILTMHNEEEYILRLMEEGADSFLVKENTGTVLAEAINSVVEKGYYYNEATTAAMVNRIKKINKKANDLQPLTARETEVIKLICEEKTSAEIAEILFIGERTIESYRQTILSKTGSKNTAGIVLYAVENKLVEKRRQA